MPKLRSTIVPLAMLTLSLPAMAQAADVPTSRMFGEDAVSDTVLATQRAGFAIRLLSTRAGVRWAVDDQVRSAERLTAGSSQIGMDVWWGTVGSELIAANVRAIIPAH